MMSNSIDIQENKNTPKRNSPKKYTLVVIFISSIPFLFSLYHLLFGNRVGFYGPSDQDIGAAGSALFGGAILLTLLALKIGKKYRIGAIILTTAALIPTILVFVLILFLSSH